LASDPAPLSVTSAYDWADRPLSVTQPDGYTKRTFAYWNYLSPGGVANPALSAVAATDELGRLTYTYYSTRGDAILIGRQLGTGYQYETRFYDALGRMTGVKDAGSAVWSNAYDMLGNRVSATDPDLGTWTYAYDSANRLVRQTDARGIQTGMTYDITGRLLTRKIILPVIADPVLTDNSYDQARPYYAYNVGRLTTSVNSERTQTFDYSTSGGVQHRLDTDASGSHDVYSGPNFDGSLRYKIYFYPTQLNVGSDAAPWAYDALGRLKSIPGTISEQTCEDDG
jgi:YD repeat-containing protein